MGWRGLQADGSEGRAAARAVPPEPHSFSAEQIHYYSRPTPLRFSING